MAYFCTSCGAEIPEDASFCNHCGKPTKTPSSPGSQQVVAAPSAGLSDNIAGALAYLFIPAIIFLLIEPYNRNKFIRFHAFQCIFYELACIVVRIAIGIALPWTMWSLHWLVSLVFFVGWVIAIIKAYQGEMYKLPVVGDLAEKQANAQ